MTFQVLCSRPLRPRTLVSYLVIPPPRRGIARPNPFHTRDTTSQKRDHPPEKRCTVQIAIRIRIARGLGAVLLGSGDVLLRSGGVLQVSGLLNVLQRRRSRLHRCVQLVVVRCRSRGRGPTI